ncbi:hypothetical protein DRO47_05475 [Candidatus Bathyarchaeota archaeon]|nr:MAG: hypothetical protein DRO47_05475 [Candidatus Bathyarchaeota archaeon]HDM45301.1 hypothetical protein [Candidatus Bathyarchaeota archaeon]
MITMPAEIFDLEEFIRISKRAEYCRIKRLGDIVKLKLRTRRRLYTLKVESNKLDEVLKRIECKVVEV